jgi:exodeoxyribonuclease VII small subunit
MNRRQTGAQPSLADDIAKLEGLVRQLEEDDVDLDRALALFEEAVGHLRTARERLAVAETRIQLVLEQADGELGISDFTP